MKSIQRILIPLLGLIVFGAAFLVGAGGARPGAAYGADDDSGTGDVTLPSDIRSRLSHVSSVSNPEQFGPATTFWEVLGKVKTRYVDKITDQERLTHGAVASMLRSLRDPFSRILTPQELDLDHQEALGKFDGVGVILGARLSGQQVPLEDAITPQGPPQRPAPSADRVWQLVVLDTVPGSAAANSDLRPGDIISKINGDRIDRAPLASKTIDDLNLMLNGPSVQQASLTVFRPSTNQTVDVHITRGGAVAEPAVDVHILPHQVAYARVYLFTPTAGQDLLRGLQRLAPMHADSLVLDLRNNPGGSLTAAEQTVAALAPGATAGIMDTRSGQQKLAASAAAPVSIHNIEVLVNSGTATTAELVAAALHEQRAAVLAGEPTFGDGLVQSLYLLRDGWAYSLTTGMLRTPRGGEFNEHGLAVDKAINPQLLGGDGAIDAALPFLIALQKPADHQGQ